MFQEIKQDQGDVQRVFMVLPFGDSRLLHRVWESPEWERLQDINDTLKADSTNELVFPDTNGDRTRSMTINKLTDGRDYTELSQVVDITGVGKAYNIKTFFGKVLVREVLYDSKPQS